MNFGANFSMGRLAYDGQYRLLLESDDDRDAGAEIFQITADSFDNLITNNFVSANFTQSNFGSNFSMGGLAYEQDPVTPVPLPASLPMMIVGLGGVALMRRAIRKG